MLKVIAVTGSPHSGKSALSLALAARLTALKNDVVVLSGDRVTPMLRVYLPSCEILQSQSVGALLMDSEITDKTVSGQIALHPRCGKLGFLAMATGDLITTYPLRFDDGRLMTLLNILYRLVDYIVIDCTSDPISDCITFKALEVADLNIQLSTCDLVGIEHWRSMQVHLKDDRFSQAKRVPAICPARRISPVHEVRELHREVLGDIRYIFPYAEELEDAMMCGRLCKHFGRREGIAFENELERLIRREVLS